MIVSTVVILVVLAGAGVALGVLGAPGLAGVTNAFGDVNETTTAIETELAVQNPNPVGASLGGTRIDYAVRMNDVEMATGSKLGVSVPSGNSTVDLTTHMRNDRIPAWWVSHIRNGEHTTVRIGANATVGLVGRNVSLPPVTRPVETDLISQFNSSETRPVNADQPPVEDPILYVNRTSATWGSISDDETPIRIRFTVYNPKSTPIPITELGYNVTMNDVAVGDGATEEPYTIPPRETRTLETTVVIDNGRLDDWWVSHLQRNQVTDLRIDFHARVDTGAAGTIRIPLEAIEYNRTIETDVFGTKDATNGSTGSADDSSESTDESSDGTTADPPDETTTTATTTTDDDGLLDTTTSNETTEDDGVLGAIAWSGDRPLHASAADRG